jgi:histidinol-phosphate/aromatic aminotransferase/cobyric acid decarboxylase-like protein/ribosomal protein S18 acetylase RimI-like enzyme
MNNAAAPTATLIRPAAPSDRDEVYRLRHEIYARELRQHPTNPAGRLSDALDTFNTCLVAEAGGRVVGFVTITPPGGSGYSIDKYLSRDQVPLPFDNGLYEIRLLTVIPERRRGPLAGLLMRAALDHIRQAGGRSVVIIGRRELLALYQKVGLRILGRTVQCGAVTFELMGATVKEIDAAVGQLHAARRYQPTELAVDAGLKPCDHGGAFFAAIGEEFNSLDRRHGIINADVLDAWFPPAPAVLEALREHLDWALRTSPPTRAKGLSRVIARVRGVPEESLVLGAGSSSLIFLALPRWLRRTSRVLILDPMYGEYAHILEHVIGCRVDRLVLNPADGFSLATGELHHRLTSGYDLVVIVNPNNPTGRHVPRRDLESVLAAAPPRTRIWIDEAYVEYAGPDQSLERFAAASPNTFVCKSLSKVYALSGARAAYLCGPPTAMTDLRAFTPPWPVSLPAQIAGVHALRNQGYYTQRYRETHTLRRALVADFRRLYGLEILDGVINSVLCHLPEGGPTAAEVVAACRSEGIFLRDCSTISPSIGPRVLRISVKDAVANLRIVACLSAVLDRLCVAAAGA